MEGGLLQLLVAAAVLLLWLLGGGKSTKAPRPRQPDLPRPRPGPPSRTPVPAPREPTPAEELYRILTGEAPPPAVPEGLEWEGAEAQSAEQVFEQEARSLETLEAAGEASHRRFREKYVAEPTPEAGPGEVKQHRVPRPGLRQAIIWREILGPPKGL